MLRNKSMLGIILMSAALVVLTGCYKDKTVILDTGAEVTKTVSFASDIMPIFNSSCNTTGCHSTGGKAPDLTAPNAFTVLSNGGYFNVNDAARSELYLWMTGKKGTPMPVSGINKDYNALILAWIKQGAQNN
jgi:hypothetical protein